MQFIEDKRLGRIQCCRILKNGYGLDCPAEIGERDANELVLEGRYVRAGVFGIRGREGGLQVRLRDRRIRRDGRIGLCDGLPHFGGRWLLA